jgi:hypothetical protein
MNRKDIPKVINGKFLASHPDCIFVFGDNLKRRGYGGGATLRDYKNTYGFITKKYPSNDPSSFYTLDDYKDVFFSEFKKFIDYTIEHKDKTFLVSRLGAGLANKNKIFEKMIKPHFQNVLRNSKNRYWNIILLDWD